MRKAARADEPAHDLILLPSRRLAVSPAHHNDTPLPIGGYLAEFVRFTIPKDGTRIDSFACYSYSRDRIRR